MGDEEEDLDDDEEDEEEDLDEEDDEYEDEDEPARTTTVTNWDWAQVNSESAIWARDASEVEDDEYKSFYKTFSKDTADPTTWIHFKAEGEVEFKSILFVPGQVPFDMYDSRGAVPPRRASGKDRGAGRAALRPRGPPGGQVPP